jgi:hypothetical protein
VTRGERGPVPGYDDPYRHCRTTQRRALRPRRGTQKKTGNNNFRFIEEFRESSSRIDRAGPANSNSPPRTRRTPRTAARSATSHTAGLKMERPRDAHTMGPEVGLLRSRLVASPEDRRRAVLGVLRVLGGHRLFGRWSERADGAAVLCVSLRTPRCVRFPATSPPREPRNSSMNPIFTAVFCEFSVV